MYDDWGMWEEASRDYETEGFERKVAAARVAATGTFKFLANAKDDTEYSWREEYAAETLAKAAQHEPAVLTRLLDELREDFRVLSSITRHAEEEEKGKFIIVDEESGYKVGGPFSSRSDAEQAVNSGKFKDKQVKVEQVGEEEEKKEEEHPGGKGNHDEAGGTKPLDKDEDDEKGGED